jgi:Ni/Co efflux regulator RcnB
MEGHAARNRRFCAAATWVRGRFTLAEMMAPARADAAILDLRNGIELVRDADHKDPRRRFAGGALHRRHDGGGEYPRLPQNAEHWHDGSRYPHTDRLHDAGPRRVLAERIVATAMAARSRYAHLPRNFR